MKKGPRVASSVNSFRDYKCRSDIVIISLQPQEDVHKAGSDLFALSYGAEAGTNLDYLRYLKHMQAVTTSSGVFEPQKLPPTDRAAYFHNLRSHLQIITWVTLNHNYLDPTNWGWKLNETKPGYIPILTDFPVALKYC